MAINNVKFRKPVVPGDQLILEVQVMNRRTKVIQIRGQAFVDGNVVAEGEFTAVVIDREDGKTKASEISK
jgi:3-hydroxymyristoyl/3-hydroxydecanoyl-(acyl carrier protein) dehydratase